MEFTNQHFAPAPEASCGAPAPPAQRDRSIKDGDVVPDMPRLRKVTNSPAQEYALRKGTVTAISDALASLFCSCKGLAKVQRNGIRVDCKELSDMPMFFWHESSLTCLSKQGEKVIYVLSRHTQDCIHIMTKHGEYIETVVRKGRPDILDAKAQAKEIAKQRRYLTRQQNRLQELHGEDTEKILERHRNNNEQLSRMTVLHPADVAEEAPESTIAPRQTPVADAMTNRGRGIETHIADRANQHASSVALGNSLRDQPVPETPTHGRPKITVEDYSEIPESLSHEGRGVIQETW